VSHDPILEYLTLARGFGIQEQAVIIRRIELQQRANQFPGVAALSALIQPAGNMDADPHVLVGT
jgi:hypothetical protein